GAFSSTTGVSGSAVVNVLHDTTTAHVGRNADVEASASSGTADLTVSAEDDTKLVGGAGSIAASSGAAAGVGADLAGPGQKTTAYIDSGTTATASGNISVSAKSSETVTSVAAGISASGSFAVNIDAAVHVLSVTTRAFVGDDPSDGTPTAGPGNVHATGSVGISADDHTEMDVVVGTVGVGTSPALTPRLPLPAIPKTT